MKELFESLLNELKNQKVLTEDKEQEYLKVFQEKLSKYKEGIFTEALKSIDEDHAEKLQEMANLIKESYENKIEDLDTKHCEMLDEMLNLKKEEWTEELTESKEIEYGKKVKEILEKIDSDHAEKLEKVVKLMESKHQKQIENVKSEMKETAVEQLSESVDKYFNAYLDEVQPKKVKVDYAKLKRLEGLFESIKEMCFLNEDYIQEEVKEAILDAKGQIDESKQEINKLMLEKIELKNKLQMEGAKQLLESKIANSSPKLQSFLRTRFADANIQEIEENFEEAIKAFKKEESDNRQKLLESVDKKEIVPKIKTETLVENKTTQNNVMQNYVNFIKKLKY